MAEAYDARHAINPTLKAYEPSDLLPPELLTEKAPIGRASSDRRKKSRQQRHTGDASGAKSRYCSHCDGWDHTRRNCSYLDLDDRQLSEIKVLRIREKADSLFNLAQSSRHSKPTPQQWQWARMMTDLDYLDGTADEEDKTVSAEDACQGPPSDFSSIEHDPTHPEECTDAPHLMGWYHSVLPSAALDVSVSSTQEAVEQFDSLTSSQIGTF